MRGMPRAPGFQGGAMVDVGGYWSKANEKSCARTIFIMGYHGCLAVRCANGSGRIFPCLAPGIIEVPTY